MTAMMRWAARATAVVLLLVLIGAVVRWWPRASQTTSAQALIWTCSMHPQIRMDHFDRCPLCGMDLTPVTADDASDASKFDPTRLALSERARGMARLATAPVEARNLVHEIRTVGKVDFDETRMAQIASRVSGRVEQVFADFPGTVVDQGDHLVSIYSPDLVSTQEELLVAARREPSAALAGEGLAASARRRLSLWGITDAQIAEVIRTGRAQTLLTVYAPLGGTVVSKMVRPGQYVSEGETLYTIADLGHVWLVVEVYETDLAWVRFGQQVRVTLEGDPAEEFNGRVGFVEPVLNEQTRTVRVRVILQNPQGKLRPGMFAQAWIGVGIMPDGQPAPTGLEGKFACPMHPYVISDAGGDCRVCQMPLEKVPGEPIPLTEPPRALAIPAEAVLTTGRRQLVYVERAPGQYERVEPRLGPRAGDYYPVLAGLAEGDLVVTRGNFLLDSQFQISGKPSLLYPDGISGGHGAHDHGAASAAGSDEARRIAQNLARLDAADQTLARQQRLCPVTDLALGSMGVPMKLSIEGRDLFLCCGDCKPRVDANPGAILEKLGPPPPPALDSAHVH
jgi:membrane fusion protein, copper/silver efflux system